jgi:carboxylesterase type B
MLHSVLLRAPVLLLLLLLLHACCAAEPPPSPTSVSLSAGEAEGFVVRNGSGVGARLWLGLPFAEPPLDRLRWRDPVPKRPWKKKWHATSYRDACAVHSSTAYAPGISEDCLYANVYAPPVSSAKKAAPVLVFFHGGSYTRDDSSNQRHNGSYLATKHKIVVITANYRLGK